MDDQSKTKDQLIAELVAQRETIASYKLAEAEHKSIRQALQTSLGVFRKVADYAARGILLLQGDKCVYFNRRWLEIIGYTADACETISFLTLVHPEDRDRIAGMYFHVFDDEELEPNVYLRILTATNETRYLEANASRILWEGRPTVLILLDDVTQRKQSEAQYQAFFTDNISSVFWIEMKTPIPVDLPVEEQVGAIFREGFIRDISDGAARVFGYASRADLIGSSLAYAYGSENTRTGGKAFGLYLKFVQADYRLLQFEAPKSNFLGETIWILTNAQGFVENGCLIRIWGSFIDTTERKMTEQALRQSEQRFRLLAENSRDMIYRMSIPDGDYEYVSPSSDALFGYTPDEFYDNPLLIRTLIHPDWQAYLAGEWAKLITGDMLPTYEYQIIHKSGETKWLNQRNTLVRDGEGRPIAIEGAVTDVTGRKLAEQALWDNEALYHSMVSVLSEGLVVHDKNGKMLAANASAGRILGLSLEELLVEQPHGPRWQLLHEDGSEVRLEDNPAIVTLRTGQPSIDTMLEINIDGQKHATILVNSRPIMDEHGNVTRVVTSFADITGRKRDQDQLKLALADKETLLQELYHRTKNNMQTIMGLISLQASQVDSKQTQEILKETENRVRAMSLVHQKLYQSRNLSSIDLGDYIKDLTILLTKSYWIRQDRIALVFELESVPVLIDTAIPSGLIINELISNVVKHAFPSDETGKLRISLKQRDDNVITIEVADNGVGLPSDLDPRKSNSMGLKTMYGIAEYQLQGKLDCETGDGVTWRLQFKNTSN